MSACTEKDQILADYMKEWDEQGLDLIINPAAWIPAPMKVRSL